MTHNTDVNLIKHISNTFNISTVTASVIANRGLTSDEEINSYININESQFLNPFQLKNMNIAVSTINEAIAANKKIAVYGDYDVDGITSTYILYDYLKSRTENIIYYIPDRIDEGYGLNNRAIDKLASQGVQLIITVDVGITAIEEVQYATSQNLGVIITDHHTPLDILPGAIAVINPKILGCTYPNKNLAGVGVAFKLVYALSGCNKAVMKKYSEAASIGTIADMVPLCGENRFIASYGLKQIAKTDNPGLNALINVSGIEKSSINSSNISFGIAPRLNAAGRIASAESSVRLFLAKNETEAMEIAQYLDEGNRQRQAEEQLILDEALSIIEKDKLYNDNVIVVAKDGWHHGIIGIVSSKITEKYYKPSCIITNSESGISKASGRSISGFNLFDALSHCSDMLLKFGGHELAAGFSLEKENIDSFRMIINEYAQNVLTNDILTPKITIDAEVSFDSLTIELANELKILEPFGTGNRTPIIALKNALISSAKINKTKKHSFLTVTNSKKYIDTPGFNLPEICDFFSSGDKADIAGTININVYRGIETVQIYLKDIKHAENSQYSLDNLRYVFKCVKDFIDSGINIFTISELSFKLRKNFSVYFGYQKIKYSIDIFNELHITDCKIVSDTIYASKGINFNKKCNINDSKLYSNLFERAN